MDKEFFYDYGITPHLQFESSPLSTSAWNSLSTAMDIHQTNQPLSDQSSDCFFESALSSMVSTPTTTAASNSPLSNDTFMMRELIGKLGSICNNSNNSGEISPSSDQHHHHQQQQQQWMMIPQVMMNNNNNKCSSDGGANNHNTGEGASCYTTPLSSPPNRNIPDHRGHLNGNGNGNSIPPLSSNLPAMPGDPGFAERAARFSSFGSRSFNGRTTQLGGLNQNEFNYRRSPAANTSTTTTTNTSTPLRLTRVSSSPSLIKAAALPAALGSSSSAAALVVDQAEFHNSDPKQGFQNGLKPVNDPTNNTCKKRKSVPKGKPKENSASTPAAKGAAENEDDSSHKRSKSMEGVGGGGGGSTGISQQDTKRGGCSDDAMVEDDDKNDTNNNNNQKPPEPPKDYIHVRARRGQATDSHSLAERVRRERISERMKLLQDLVPGCNKVTGKALMLDEIINYVQSLQRQVEFLSMKLSSVNPRLEMSMDNMISKDGFQPNCSHSQPMYSSDPLSSTLYGGSGAQQSHQNNITNGGMAPSCSQPNHHDMQLPTLDGFTAASAVSQMSSLCEGDLHSIVQMGYLPNLSQDIPLQSPSLHGSNQAPLMKIEF